MMQKPFEFVEIELDRKRPLFFGIMALCKAQTAINKMREAKPGEHASIDFLMIDSFNKVFTQTGLIPLDILICMLWAGLLHEDPKLTIEAAAELIEKSSLHRADISALVWKAYFQAMGKNLKPLEPGEQPDDAEKKTKPSTGSNSGVSPGSS